MKEKRPTPPPEAPSRLRYLPWVLFAVLLLLLVRYGGSVVTESKTIPYNEFRAHLEQGEVKSCFVEGDTIRGHIVVPGEEDSTEFDFNTARVEDPELVEKLQAAGVEYTGVPPSNLSGLLGWLLPLGLILVFWVFLFRRTAGAGGQAAALSFGKSKAKLVADLDTGVDFGDVAGCEEAKQELAEVVDFLGNPDRYIRLGAKIPKGILVVGPPGTGKTLLARAVAGEAGVPFFSISGSEFVEMFVGVGAARVRDLFEQAQAKAPCIVFIDELDAIGRQRGVQIGAVNDEREQTLNQLLVEMDGFEPNSGVILLSATNRPDVLDRALLRPGRFDRQVVIDAPDAAGRLAILGVHARGKPLAEDVDLERIARSTPGFAGADLANALNEAALLAARRKSEEIGQRDIEDAVEKVVAGPERKSRRIRESERVRVAHHEAGHAVAAAYLEHADPVHKISVVPRGSAALGYTMQLPVEDQALQTRAELDDRISGLLAGRAAEQLVLGEISTGAANDLEIATNLARRMVCLYGMGRTVGLMSCAHESGGTYMRSPEDLLRRDCSEDTARKIDEEVQGILGEAADRAAEILSAHRPELERVAAALLEHETLDSASFEALLGSGESGTVAGSESPPPGPMPASSPDTREIPS